MAGSRPGLRVASAAGSLLLARPTAPQSLGVCSLPPFPGGDTSTSGAISPFLICAPALKSQATSKPQQAAPGSANTCLPKHSLRKHSLLEETSVSDSPTRTQIWQGRAMTLQHHKGQCWFHGPLCSEHHLPVHRTNSPRDSQSEQHHPRSVSYPRPKSMPPTGSSLPRPPSRPLLWPKRPEKLPSGPLR